MENLLWFIIVGVVAGFLAGLLKIETSQEKWRPKLVLNYIQDRYIKPDIIIPINNQK